MAERYADLSRAEAIRRLGAWQARARDFSGWSFDDLNTRDLGPPKPWSYPARVLEVAREIEARSVVDLGTGGGERLASMRDGLPPRTVATEEWHVNVPIAAAALRPLGVEVVWCDSLRPPFASASFDLVLSRHEAWAPVEVARMLSPRGVALTQQVAAAHWIEAQQHFPRWYQHPDHQRIYAEDFEALGYEVTVRYHEERVAYPSLGEFAYMLFIAPWYIEDLDAERDLDALLAVERDCLFEEGLVTTAAHYLLEAWPRPRQASEARPANERTGSRRSSELRRERARYGERGSSVLAGVVSAARASVFLSSSFTLASERNSRMPRPSAPPRSATRVAPNSSARITSTISNSCQPKLPNIAASFPA